MSIDSFFDSIFSLVSPSTWASAPERIAAFLDVLRPYSTVVSLLFLTGIVYCFFRIEQIYEATLHVDHDEHEAHGESAVPQSATDKRWDRIQSHLHTDKESDWRLAILEADILLDEMVTNMGYVGDSLGEKLKGIEKSDFTSLDKAWEAHAVRNKIAHEGSKFALTDREAKRVISLYEDVFKEFRYI